MVNAVRTPMTNVDDTERMVSYKPIKKQADGKTQICEACGHSKTDSGQCKDIWHSHRFDMEWRC